MGIQQIGDPLTVNYLEDIFITGKSAEDLKHVTVF